MNIQALKALVIGMGVLIVIGVTVIVVTVFNRIQDRASGAVDASQRFDVAIPQGATLLEAVPDGQRMVLRLETPDGPQIMVVNLRSGAVETTLVLRP
ncbi:MAG: hypothetical protein QGF53_15620 [Alphaproteobacteria bacterium]|jgi:hypothetical protein|nr:hypothetical protein [Alphaproteobacteria bacterium]